MKDEDSNRVSTEYDVNMGKSIERYEKKLRLLYVLSALLDIMGYVIRTIGYIKKRVLTVEWYIVEAVCSRWHSAPWPSLVQCILAFS